MEERGSLFTPLPIIYARTVSAGSHGNECTVSHLFPLQGSILNTFCVRGILQLFFHHELDSILDILLIFGWAINLC